jgi:hypothetical protein
MKQGFKGPRFQGKRLYKTGADILKTAPALDISFLADDMYYYTMTE